MPSEAEVSLLEGCGAHAVATPTCMPPSEALKPRRGIGTSLKARRAAVILPGLDVDFTAPRCRLTRSTDSDTAWAVAAVEDRTAASKENTARLIDGPDESHAASCGKLLLDFSAGFAFLVLLAWVAS